MVKKDIVIRKDHPEDRRIKLVVLTEKGKALEKETPKINDILDNCCSGFDPNDVEILTILLKKLDRSLSGSDLESC